MVTQQGLLKVCKFDAWDFCISNLLHVQDCLQETVNFSDILILQRGTCSCIQNPVDSTRACGCHCPIPLQKCQFFSDPNHYTIGLLQSCKLDITSSLDKIEYTPKVTWRIHQLRTFFVVLWLEHVMVVLGGANIKKILLYDFDTQVGLRQIGLVVMVVALGGSKTSDHSDPQKKNQKNELKKFKLYQNQLTFDIIGWNLELHDLVAKY